MNETLLIFATLAGPILAVQAQKWLERFREAKDRREKVFKTLMATRGSRLSLEHVQALNMIDLEFRGRKYKGVRDAWALYRQHFEPSMQSKTDTELTLWMSKREDQFIALLRAMSWSLNYPFNDLELAKSAYMPTALTDMDQEWTEIRKALNSSLTGKHALKMDVVSFPDLEDSESQKRVDTGIQKLLEEKRLH